MASATPRMDELVKDYLLYRGFTGCIRVLENELKTDKDKSLRVDKIVEQITVYITTHELAALWQYWNALNIRFFSRLEQRYMATVTKLEHNLLKLYIIVAYQNQRSDKIREFFEVMAPEIQSQDAFKDWFAFPFLKNVEEHTSFLMYFSKQWQDTFMLSLSNFLGVVIQSMYVPTLLSFEADQRKMKQLQEENLSLKQQMKYMTGENNEGDTPIKHGTFADSSTNMELMDDFFVHSSFGDHSRKDEQTAKTEKRKFFPSANILGFIGQNTANQNRTQISSSNQNKGQLSSTNQNKASRVASAPFPQNSYKVTKPKIADDKIAKPKIALFQSISTSYVKPSRINTPDSLLQKNSSNTSEVQSQKIEDRLIVTSPPVLSKKLTDPGDKSRNMLPDTLRDVKDSFLKRSSPAKSVPKSSSGFTSYIIKPSPSDTMAIAHTDTDSPFLLLSQESYDEHSSTVTSVRFSYSSQYITSVDRDGIVKIWTWSPQPVTKATVMLKPAFLSAEWANKTDRHVLLGTKTGNIRLYDVRENKSVCEVPTDPVYPNVVCLCPNPSGTEFVSSGISDGHGMRAGKLCVWELKTMKVISSLSTPPSPIAINCMSFNHNGTLLLTGGADGHIRLYDINQAMCINEWTAHNGDLTAIQFSSDETSCYSMGTDDKFLQWSMNKCGQQLADISLHGGACNPVTLATDCYNGNITHGKLFAFDTDGSFMLTCGKNGGIIYDLNETCATNVLELRRHWSPVSTVDWSPAVDNRVCLTGSFDGRIEVSTFLNR